MKKIYILFLLLVSHSILTAQNDVNALRFSRTQNLGTARYMSMGGAFTALGGDISALSDNPAGLGVFRNSQIVFTPTVNLSRITSNHQGSKHDNTFQIGTLGFVASLYNGNFDWRGINIGFNYTNLNNFNRQGNQQVMGSTTSLLDVFALRGGNVHPDELYQYDANSWLAYDTYLLDTTSSGYYTTILAPDDRVNQVKHFKEDGYQGEYAISFATNYQDKFMAGVTIGIQSLKYKYRSLYTENVNGSSPSDLEYYNYDEYLRTEGTGYNFKFGLLYIPIPAIRIGASIHTPTYYQLNEDAHTSIHSQFNATTPNRVKQSYYQSTNEIPGFGSYSYNYKTPWRASIGLATVLGNRAILSADYEYVNYSKIHFSDASDDFSFNDYYSGINSAMKALYRSTHNFKVGAEVRVSDFISLRAGYNYQQNPYNHNYAMAQYVPSGKDLQTFSAGIGINARRVFCDLAYMYRKGKGNTTFYYYQDGVNEVEATPMNNDFVDQQIRMSIGVRF